MAREKDRQKVTFMLPNYLIEMADILSGKLGVDRYDVLRLAVGQGMMVVLAQSQMQQDPQRYAEDLKAITMGDTKAFERVSKSVTDDALEGLKGDIEKHRKRSG